MVDLSYGYANARARAMYSQLFDRDRLREMIDVSTLAELIEMLEESPYKPAFVAASVKYSGIELVRRALDDNLIAAYRKILKISPEKARPFLVRYLKHWEVNNLKKILAAKALGKNVTPSDLLLLENGSEKKLAAFISAASFGDCVKEFAFTEYAPAVAGVLQEYKKTQDFRVFLSALDKHHYGKLSEAAAKLKDPQVARFLRIQMDVRNAMTVLRMKQTKVPTATIKAHLLPTQRRAFAQELLQAPTVDVMLSVVATRLNTEFPDEAIAEATHGKSLSGIEVALEARVLSEARKTMRVSVLSLGTLVGYLHLKREDVHSLRKMAYATQFDVKSGIRKTILAAA